MKNKTIILILIVAIAVLAYVAFVKPKSANDNYQIPAENIKDVFWDTLSQKELFSLIEDKVFIMPESKIELSQSIDLTGDGLTEGIFVGNGGNNNISFILIKNSDETALVAQQKNKDGEIYPVQLLEVGRVMVQEGFNLLPEENGFLTESMSYNQEKETFVCNEDGVNAFKWNPRTKLFEWNQAMTEKYTTQICK